MRLARDSVRSVEMGWELRHHGNFEDAVKALTKAGEPAQELPSAFELDLIRVDLGDCLLRLRRYEEAYACFEQCSAREVRHPALFGMAAALHGLGLLEEAEMAYQNLLAERPGLEEALANLLSINVELFRLGEIEKYSRRLLELNPRSIPALKGLAMVLIERREFSKAVRFLAQLSPAVLEAGGRDEGIEYRLSQTAITNLEEARWRMSSAD